MADRVWLCWINNACPHLLRACTTRQRTSPPEPGVNYIACLQLWSTHIPPESPLGISQCTRLTASTYVTMFALLLHLTSIWACVIDRMPSGLHWNNSAMSINHERSMHTEANNVPARGQHILSFCYFHVSCERCTLSHVESLSELLQVFKASRWSDAHTSSNLCAFAHRRRTSKLTLASAAVCLFHCSAATWWTALD